jgi:fluoride exporter
VSRIRDAALIVIGGMVGTALRAELGSALPSTPGQWPWTTFWINISGALALGVLLELLAAGTDDGLRRSLRLGLGTGMLGGFTTYSAFSVETVELLRAGQWLPGLGYALASVAAGIAAAGLAIFVVRKLRRSTVAA